MPAAIDWSPRVAKFGATLLREYREGSVPYVEFTCSCGSVGRKSKPNLTAGQSATCSTCSKQRMGTLAGSGDTAIVDYFKDKSSNFSRIVQRANASQKQKLRLELICTCGTLFEVVWDNVSHRKADPICIPCAAARKRATMSGPLHPQYDHSLSPEHRARRRPGIEVWYKDVLRAWGFTCCITGTKGGRLSAHHLYNWKDHPEWRLDITNGVAISKALHDEFHCKYGRGDNTLEQFEQFFHEKTGRQFYTLAELSHEHTTHYYPGRV